jgi:hypothetical protein
MTSLRNVFAAAAAITTLAVSAPALAGHDGEAVGAGLLGFGVGAVVGSALTPSTVVVAPPPPPAYTPPPPAPPPRAYYGPAAYGPPAWSPGWYRYCRYKYGPDFDPQSGYFQGRDGEWYFCR